MGKDKTIKFRVRDGEDIIIDEVMRKLGLPTESATIRILIKLGSSQIDDFFNRLKIVAQPLKLSEVGFFTSSINLYLKQQKKESDKKIP